MKNRNRIVFLAAFLFGLSCLTFLFSQGCDHVWSAKKVSTGTTSTIGGPWRVMIWDDMGKVLFEGVTSGYTLDGTEIHIMVDGQVRSFRGNYHVVEDK